MEINNLYNHKNKLDSLSKRINEHRKKETTKKRLPTTGIEE